MDAARAPREAELRALVASGDHRRAADLLVREHARDVLGLCIALVRDRSLAEDMAQDTFSRAFAALEDFRAEASAKTWILAVARNRCLDHLRRVRRDPWAGVPDEAGADDIPDDVPLAPELLLRRGDVEHALAVLAEGERALVVLRYKSGLEYAELAEAFGLREGTVRMRLSRALARMRRALEDRDRDGGPEAWANALPAPPPAPLPMLPGSAGAQRRRAVPQAAGAARGAASQGPAAGALPLVRGLPAPLAAFACDPSEGLRRRLAELASSLPTR